ncbi:MAG TPA: OmpA family protein [Azospirillaceae bacterium]|nr:OmpA family protein [Azospirillaceae bacterium]
MKQTRFVTLALGMGLLAGCSSVENIPVVGNLFGGGGTGNTQAATPASATAASPFTRQLAAEYQQYTRFENRQMMDTQSAGVFQRKAQQTAAGQMVAPENPADWDIDNQAEAQAAAAGRQRLVAALDAGGRERNPYYAAVAQARYDCWVEQLDEGWQTNDIRACRSQFEQALTQLEQRPVAARPVSDPQYLVFFDFDRAEITPQARQTIQEVAENLRTGRIQNITVVGHADTSGSDQYNRQLSQRRAEAVRQALQQAGVQTNQINTNAAGEEQPLVQTPDGVREPSNRRAEVRFQ